MMENQVTPQPPHSSEAEAATLGAVLVSPGMLCEIIDILEPKDFYEPRNGKVYDAMRLLFLEGNRVDVITLAEKLRQDGHLDDVGGISYLATLADTTPESSHAVYYAKIVKEKSILRQLIDATARVREKAYAQNMPVEEILDDAEQMIFQITHFSPLNEAVPLSEVLRETFMLLDERLDRKEKYGGVMGVRTGLNDLDTQTGGLLPGEFIVLGARPSVGKTTLALNIAEHVAVKERKPVAIFSVETSKEQVARNLLCIHTGISAYKMRTGYTSREENEQLGLAVGELSEAPIYIDDTSPLTPLALKSKARRLKAKDDIALIIVDYLQLMNVPGVENKQQEIALISRHLKSLAKELHVPLFAVSQLRRAAEEHARPRLSDLRESGAIEQDADIVLLLYREDYQSGEHRSKGVAELIIAKQRHGPTGVINIQYDFNCLRFSNLTAEELDDLEIRDFST